MFGFLRTTFLGLALLWICSLATCGGSYVDGSPSVSLVSILLKHDVPLLLSQTQCAFMSALGDLGER